MKEANLNRDIARLRIIELEETTANNWLALGTITEDGRGEENTYYTDQFENRFFCKNYPR